MMTSLVDDCGDTQWLGYELLCQICISSIGISLRLGPRLIQLNATSQDETKLTFVHRVERIVIKSFFNQVDVINWMRER
jgi:hypothetical protein